MKDDRRSPVSHFLWNTLILLASLSLLGEQAMAQKAASAQVSTTYRGILFRCLREQFPEIQIGGEADTAFDPASKRNFAWDEGKKAWIDTKTLQPAGACKTMRGATFKYCLRDQFPEISLGGESDTAFDPVSKRNFAWDEKKQAWIDTKTLESVCPKSPPPAKPKISLSPGGAGDGKSGSGLYNYEGSNIGPYWYASVGYERRNFYKWKDVSGNSPTVVTNDATSSTNGVVVSLGYKPGGWPVRAAIDAYWAGGLKTDAMLTNGRRILNDVTDYGIGAGVRFVPGGYGRVQPWASVSALYERNQSDYKEYNSLKSLILSESRSQSSWTGEYGVGGTYWIQPRIGVDFGGFYNGQFKSENADENFGFRAGFTWRFAPPSPFVPPPPAPGKVP